MANQQLDEDGATGASGFARLIAVAALGFFVACVPASASGYMTLGLPDKDKAVTAIGQAPKKETIELKLGDIRTREAQLPGGSTTLRERMAMRAKLREKRQMAVTMATREPSVNFEGDNQATPASASNDSNIDLPPPPPPERIDEFGMSDINM